MLALCFIMLDEVSVKRQLQREQSLVPECCPNPCCRHHRTPQGKFWRKNGSVSLSRFPYRVQRFVCKECGRTFGASVFAIFYRQKVWGGNRKIWELHRLGATRRETARIIGCTEHLVRVRLRNMARWAELKHAKFSENLAIDEPIVYDGLENFSYSQYDPNNINHAVGKKSLFIYDYNFSPLNRKGRMTERQAARKAELDEKHGEYPKNAIYSSTKRIFERLSGRSAGTLYLFTDKHLAYQRVVEDLGERPISHVRISSKVHRNYQNPLFAVNNIDLQTRHNLSAFKRETIAFSKHEIAMQDSFTLYLVYRNYMRPKFWGTHRSDPLSAEKSPAMEVGIASKILSFDEFFGGRVFPSQVSLNEDAWNRYGRIEKSSRRKIAPAPAY